MSKGKTKYPLNVWQERRSNEVYAFPVAEDAWGEEILASFNVTEWLFKYTLPCGIEVTEVARVNDDKVSCNLRGSLKVYTAGWAIEEV